MLLHFVFLIKKSKIKKSKIKKSKIKKSKIHPKNYSKIYSYTITSLSLINFQNKNHSISPKIIK